MNETTVLVFLGRIDGFMHAINELHRMLVGVVYPLLTL
jgi:hypothetical protein